MAFTASHLYFDDLALGQEWESQGRTVTETDIVNFAGVSGDFNAIHMDHEFAKGTPFRRPIAHGVLVMAMGTGLSTNSPPVRTIAFLSVRDWQFKGVIFAGDTIHVRTKVVFKEVRGRGKRGEVHWQRSIVNQEGKVVQEGVTITLVETRFAVSSRPESARGALSDNETGINNKGQE